MLGLRGTRTALLGEARFQPRPLTLAVLGELHAKLALVPEPIDQPTFAVWAPRGAEAAVRGAGARAFSMKDVMSRQASRESDRG